LIQVSFTDTQFNKLGNSLIYLTKDNQLAKTSLLKLVYFLDEYSIKSRGIPFFNFDYKIWKHGPVKTQLYYSFHENNQFKDFIKEIPSGDYKRYSANREFIDDEFSQVELELLFKIKKDLSHKNARDLIKLTHHSDSPWRVSAEKYGIYQRVEKGLQSITDQSIEMNILIQNDSFKLGRYNEYLDFFGKPN
jgi:uncharacterized phage-associated protein